MGKILKILLWVVLVLAGLVGLARGIAIRWVRIPEQDPVLTSSLTPTLRAGDLVLLWRLTSPGKGDLALCDDPENQGMFVVGRIAAAGGDTVRVEGQTVFVNDAEMGTETVCVDRKFEVNDPDTGDVIEQRCQMEALHGVVHPRGSTAGFRPPVKVEHTVGDGKVWLLSDNRLYPYDSREYGSLPESSCHEMVFFRLVGKKGYFDVGTRLTFIR